MMRFLVLPLAAAMLAVFAFTPTATAHSFLGRAFKERHDLKSASCYACHKQGKDPETGKSLGKEHYNEFGEAVVAALKEHDITARYEAAKEEGKEAKEAAEKSAVEQMLKALDAVEAKTSSSGKTFKALIEAGELEGIKLK